MNNATTIAPSKLIKTSILIPLPFATRTICKAAHSNKPISSKISNTENGYKNKNTHELLSPNQGMKTNHLHRKVVKAIYY